MAGVLGGKNVSYNVSAYGTLQISYLLTQLFAVWQVWHSS